MMRKHEILPCKTVVHNQNIILLRVLNTTILFIRHTTFDTVFSLQQNPCFQIKNEYKLSFSETIDSNNLLFRGRAQTAVIQYNVLGKQQDGEISSANAPELR